MPNVEPVESSPASAARMPPKPVVPVKPGVDPDAEYEYQTGPEGADEEPAAPNPCEALVKFRKH